MVTISVRFNHKYVDPLHSVVQNYSINSSYYCDYHSQHAEGRSAVELRQRTASARGRCVHPVSTATGQEYHTDLQQVSFVLFQL